MTGKERLTRLFEGKDIDRMPIWLLFPYFHSPSYADIFNSPSYKPVLGKVFEHTEIIDRRHFNTGFCFTAHPDIKRESRNYRDGNYTISETVISYKNIDLRRCIKRSSDNTIIENFVKDIDDLDKILSLPYKVPEPSISKFLEEDLEFGDRGLMGVDLADPLSILHNLCSETDFVLYTLTDTRKVNEFLDIISDRVFDTYKYLLERKAGPLYWISGAEFAVPPMVSPVYFNDLVVKHTKRLCSLIRSYGKYSMLHCHGRIEKVLDGLKEIGFDSIHPVEASPMGDCTLARARAVFGKDTILAGNIQYGDLWEKSEEEIEEIVKTAIDEGSTGRFMLAATGGPSADEINERVSDNYIRIIDTALEYGKMKYNG